LACTFTGVVTVGNTITGSTSAATGEVIAVTDDTIVYTKAVGTFQSGEDIEVSAVVVASATDTGIAGGASTQELSAIYTNAAADLYRDDIDPVPGSGSILGTHRYNN